MCVRSVIRNRFPFGETGVQIVLTSFPGGDDLPHSKQLPRFLSQPKGTVRLRTQNAPGVRSATDKTNSQIGLSSEFCFVYKNSEPVHCSQWNGSPKRAVELCQGVKPPGFPSNMTRGRKMNWTPCHQ